MEVLDAFDFRFPIYERRMKDGYRYLLLAERIRACFAEGAQIVRVNSLELARFIPDYGGETSGTHSLSWHQDNFSDPNNPGHVLCLSKLTYGGRGSSTLFAFPETAKKLAAITHSYFSLHRDRIAADRAYDTRFKITERQYNACLDSKDGFERVLSQVVRAYSYYTEREEIAALNILNYLIRGACADELMKITIQLLAGQYLREDWHEPGVVFVDNRAVLHARFGGNNPPLKRNFFTFDA